MGCVSKWYQRQVFFSQHEPPLTLIRPAPTEMRKASQRKSQSTMRVGGARRSVGLHRNMVKKAVSSSCVSQP